MIINRFFSKYGGFLNYISSNAASHKTTGRLSNYLSTKSDEFDSKKSTNKGNKITETDLSAIDRDRIRNFSIIAHIDHGKSTLADCMLEHVEAISKRTKENDRVLDKLQVERERGITVKAQTASFIYEVRNGIT